MAGEGRLAGLAESVLRRFRAACPDGPLVIAVSGGADSAVCAWAALQTGPDVRAVFVDHGFPESAAMARAARAVTTALDCPLTVADVAVAGGPSPEAQARSARLAALEAGLRPGESLLTGHTADDQAETVLGNLVRGAGPAGLSGIPVRRGRWARPLLEVSRSETRELAALLRLPWVDDPANDAAHPRRNVLRREVLPDLENRFNPALRAALGRTARILAADDDLLTERAAAVPIRMHDGTARLPASLLATLPVPVASRAVREAMRRVHPPYPGSDADVMAALAVAAGEGPRAALTGGYRAERSGPWLLVGPPHEPASWAPARWRLPGTLTVPGVRLDAWVEDAPPAVWPLSRRTAVLDADAVGLEMEVRPAATGDRIAIAAGSKPVRDALAEARVPAAQRPSWPVAVDVGRLVWIVGVRAASWARPGPSSQRFLWLDATMEVR